MKAIYCLARISDASAAGECRRANTKYQYDKNAVAPINNLRTDLSSSTLTGPTGGKSKIYTQPAGNPKWIINQSLRCRVAKTFICDLTLALKSILLRLCSGLPNMRLLVYRSGGGHLVNLRLKNSPSAKLELVKLIRGI